jgi:ferrous iron transport protein A
LHECKLSLTPNFVTFSLLWAVPLQQLNKQKECMKKLSELEAGEVGIIHSFEKDELYIKLLEMGCVPGEPVKVVQVAPLGDPISIEVSGYHLSLRISEADSIIVTPAN